MRGSDDLEFKPELTPTGKSKTTVVFVENTTAMTQPSPRSAEKQEKPKEFTTEEMMTLIRVQSMIRGWIQRKKYRV